jgi:hypothetical protein
MPKSPAKALDLEVVTTSATVAEVPQLAELSEAQMAAEIRADITRYERTSREAAFIAIRIGIRLIQIRDNEAFGSLTLFIKNNFNEAKGKRTLERYIATAMHFLMAAGMLDKATHRLTGKAWDAAAPIVNEQLELFTDPEAKLEGALKKVVKWVGDRGLADIYKDLESRRNDNRPPKPTKASAAKRLENQGNEALQLETLAKHAEENAQELMSMAMGEAWKALESERLLFFITQALALASTALPDLASRNACLPALADLENQANRFSEAVAGHIKEARRSGR